MHVTVAIVYAQPARDNVHLMTAPISLTHEGGSCHAECTCLPTIGMQLVHDHLDLRRASACKDMSFMHILYQSFIDIQMRLVHSSPLSQGVSVDVVRFFREGIVCAVD